MAYAAVAYHRAGTYTIQTFIAAKAARLPVPRELPAKTIIVLGLPFRALSSGVVEPTVADFAELFYADRARRLVPFTYQPGALFTAAIG
jgi:hypothetical protein